MKDLDSVVIFTLAGLATVWPTCSPVPVFNSTVSAAIGDTVLFSCASVSSLTLDFLDLRQQQYFWADAGADGKSSCYIGWYMIYQLMWSGDVLFTLIQYLRRCSLMYSLPELVEFYIAFITSCSLHTSLCDNSSWLCNICPVKRIVTLNIAYIYKYSYANYKLGWLQKNILCIQYMSCWFLKAQVLSVCREKESATTQISLWISEPNLLLSNWGLSYTWRKFNNTHLHDRLLSVKRDTVSYKC